MSDYGCLRLRRYVMAPAIVLNAHTFNRTTPGRYIPPQKNGALIDT
jgi:hypothetical protein